MLPSRETAMTGTARRAGTRRVRQGGRSGRVRLGVGWRLAPGPHPRGTSVGPFRGRRRDGSCRVGDGGVDRAAAPSTARGCTGGYRRPALGWPADSRAADPGAPLPESRREFDAVGMPFAGRGARLDETVTLWRRTWDGQGEFADALPAARSGGPPVWLAGGDTTKVIERVATTYDGWLPYLPDVNAYARAWDRIRAQAVREVTPALYATVNLNDDKARADEELDEYLRAYYGQPLDVMHYVQAIRGGSVAGMPRLAGALRRRGRATHDPADRLAQRAPRIRGRTTVARTEGA